MANSYFQFKQFTIQQDACAMKVTTDGCLFGAIAAREIRDLSTPRILDIGTGTGVLSLMLAQQNETAFIDAIELDEAAATQAKDNVEASPWRERIHVFQGDILDYQPTGLASIPKISPAIPAIRNVFASHHYAIASGDFSVKPLYDVIISNPPFYEKQLSSPAEARQLAHHSSGLTLRQLFQQVRQLLPSDGRFLVLVPFYRAEEANAIAKEFGLYPEKQWRVKQTPKHNWFRSVLCYCNSGTRNVEEKELMIKDAGNEYSGAFTELLRPFYLKL